MSSLTDALVARMNQLAGTAPPPLASEVAAAIIEDAKPVSEPVKSEPIAPKPSFREIAEPLVNMGVPITPVRPGSKRAFLPDFPTTATTDVDQIYVWDQQFPNHNAACVARAEDGGVWFWEVDSKDVLRRIQADTGHGVLAEINTFRVRSRPERGHFYFRHNEASKALGNISQSYVIGQDWSVRTNREYVVAPGSIHPDTGKPYEALDWNAPIAEAPQWLIDWLLSQKVQKQTASASTGDNVPRNDRGKVPHGSIHGWMLTVGGRLRNAGLNRNEIEQILLRLVHENCEPPIDESKVVAMAKSVTTLYPVGDPMGGQLLMSSQIQSQNVDDDEAEEKDERDLQITFPDFPIFPGALTDLALAMFPSLPIEFKIWGLVTYWGLMRSGLDTFGVEHHIQPRFYSMFIAYPNIGKTACINECRNAYERIKARIEFNLSNSMSPRRCSEVVNFPSVDSGQFLAAEFADIAKKSREAVTKNQCEDIAAKGLLDPDEAADFFEKGRSTNGRVSTLFIEMLKLYSGNRTGSGTKTEGRVVVENAHFAILSGTQVKKYPLLWIGTGSGQDGLRSRFVQVGTNNPPVPPIPVQTDEVAVQEAIERLALLAQLPGQNVVLSDAATAEFIRWHNSYNHEKDCATRVTEVVKQLITVLAVTNLPENHRGNKVVVSLELAKEAMRFGDYLMKVRELMNPNDSWNNVQSMENAIMEWYRKNASMDNPKSMNACRRGIHPERLPGGLGSFKLAWKNAVETGVLKYRQKVTQSWKMSL